MLTLVSTKYCKILSRSKIVAKENNKDLPGSLTVWFVRDLGPTIFASLLGRFSEFAVVTLRLFQLIFAELGLLDIPSFQSERVGSVSGIRWQHKSSFAPRQCGFGFGQIKRGLVDLLAHVPVSSTIKVDIAHIVSIYLTHHNAISLNFTLKVIIRLIFDSSISNLIIGSYTIRIINKVDSPRKFMLDRSTP